MVQTGNGQKDAKGFALKNQQKALSVKLGTGNCT